MVTEAGENTARQVAVVAIESESEAVRAERQTRLLRKRSASADGEVERSHTGPSAAGARTWHTPDQGSPIIKQVQEKQGSPAYEADKPVCWQALRRTWNTNRLSAHPQSSEHPTGICSEPYRKSLPMKTPSAQPHTPLHRTTSAEPCRSLLHGSTESFKSPLHRTSSGLASSHTSSAVTTLVPQNKVGFSSITISSRKVNRSSSLPSSEGPPCSHSTKFRESHTHETMDQNSRGVTVQRKATIVKVTEQRMMPSSGQSINRAETPQSSHALDTVVHRRKATIIKVTEQRESYSPSKVRSGTRHPEYRHSYTEGAYKENSMWSHGNHSEHTTVPSYPRLNSTERPSSVSAPNASTSDPVKNSGTLHTSTLRLFVNNPPAIAAAAPSELSPKAFGQRSNRPNRPLSCYGNVFAHSEPSKENVTPPTVRKWSCGLPQETNINPVNSLGSLIRPGTAVKEAGQQVADTVKPNRRAKGVSPEPEDTAKRSPPCLTLIKDPQSHQSPEEVLALNAAAIIANIKLQRQLSAKKTPNGKAEKDSTASLRGNTVTDEGKCTQKPPPDRAQCHSQPQAAFIPLSLGPQRSGQTVSLQEALQRSRPHFIARSQDRVQKLEQRAQERRELANSTKLQLDAARRQRRGHGGRIRSCMNDNLFKSRDAAVRGKELRSKHSLADLKKKKEEEKKKEVCLGNRQRVELFKKKLLDQILQRGNK
ncbi:(E2-independent) E3 ubiquitin-conjugating enzyme FATS [Aulostomus maculatus]